MRLAAAITILFLTSACATNANRGEASDDGQPNRFGKFIQTLGGSLGNAMSGTMQSYQSSQNEYAANHTPAEPEPVAMIAPAPIKPLPQQQNITVYGNGSTHNYTVTPTAPNSVWVNQNY